MQQRTVNILFDLGDDRPIRKKLSVAFLVDLSGSMQGEPLKLVISSVSNMLQPIVKYNMDYQSGNKVVFADEILLMTFHSEIRRVCPWVHQDDFDFFTECLFAIEGLAFQGMGITRLHDALIETLDYTQNNADRDNEKIVILFSDGCEYGSNADKAALDQKIKETGIKIYGLHFGDKNGLSLLEELSRKTGGKCHKAPTVEDIPKVLSEIADDIYDQQIGSIRGKLLRRLNSHQQTMDKGSHRDWFRVISINANDEEAEKHKAYLKKFSNDGNSYKHSVYYQPVNAQAKETKRGIAERFKKSTDGKPSLQDILYEDILQNLDDQRKDKEHFINFQVNDTPFFFLIFRGNNRYGVSQSLILSDCIERLRRAPDFVSMPQHAHLILIILLDEYIRYTDEDKRNLYALMMEIENLHSREKIHGILFISSSNLSPRGNKDGFKTLEQEDFEDLVVETLININGNQSVITKLIDNCGTSHTPNRFLCVGNLSVYLDIDSYIKNSSCLFTVDFLKAAFDKEKIAVNEKDIRDLVNDFFKENIIFDNLKKGLLKSNSDADLYQQIDSPSINVFADYGKMLLVKVPNTYGQTQYRDITFHYVDEIDYIQKLLFDVKEYVESCHSLERFKSTLDLNYSVLLNSLTEKIKAITDLQMSGDIEHASPVRGQAWIEMCHETVENYLKKGINLDIEKDGYGKEITAAKETFNKQSVDGLFKELQRKIESMPLSSAVLTKYAMFGLLTATGTYFAGSLFSSPLVLPLAIFMGVVSICAGGYKIFMFKKQLAKLLKRYAMAHRYIVRKQAFEYLQKRTGDLLNGVLDRFKRNDDGTGKKSADVDPFSPDRYSEDELHTFFRDALHGTLSSLIKSDIEKGENTTLFNISLTAGLLPRTKRYVPLIDSAMINGYPCKDDIHWNDWMRLVTRDQSDLEKIAPVFVDTRIKVNELLRKITTLSDHLRVKLHISELVKDQKTRIHLLDRLINGEKDELKNLFPHDEWKSTIESLALGWQEISSIRAANIFALWREIAFYQIWLLKLRNIVENRQDSTSILDNDMLFRMWQKVYATRRSFRRKLEEISVRHWHEKITQHVGHIGAFINGELSEQAKEVLFQYIRNYSFPTLSNETGRDYSQYSRSYFTSKRLKDSKQEILDQDNLTWAYAESSANYEINFITYLNFPTNDSPILKDLYENFDEFFNPKNKDCKNYFIDDENVLKIKPKDLKFPFSIKES